MAGSAGSVSSRKEEVEDAQVFGLYILMEMLGLDEPHWTGSSCQC